MALSEENRLDDLLSSYTTAVERIIQKQAIVDNRGAELDFYELLNKASVDLCSLVGKAITKHDTRVIGTNCRAYYAPAVQLMSMLYKCKVREWVDQFGADNNFDTPVRVRDLILYGKTHLDLSPFKDYIRGYFETHHSSNER